MQTEASEDAKGKEKQQAPGLLEEREITRRDASNTVWVYLTTFS